MSIGERRARKATLDWLSHAMDGRLLFKNCTLLEGERLESGRVVVVQGNRVAQVGRDAEAPALPGDWAVDAKGRLLLPGRVDAHASLTAPVHGLGPWTTSEVEALAAASLARALRAGVTTVFEHLSWVEQPAEALAAVTITPARIYRLADQTGSIAKGKLAELALIDGDPSKNIGDLRQVELVMRDGKIMDAQALRDVVGISGPPKK